MNDSKDHKAATEPPLDCHAALRDAVDDLMQYQFSHSREAMNALQRLVDAAEAGADEIERLREQLKLHDAWLGQAHCLCSDLGVPLGHIEDRLFEAMGRVHNAE